MWMGGTIPLGYDVKERKLVLNVVEATLVRHIFTRYAELGSGTLLQAELDADGHRSKHREGAGGLIAGGRPFSRGILYLILQNRLYRGEVKHNDNVYPGQHEAIVEAELWTIVQAKLSSSRRDRKLSTGAEAPSLLAGLIFDADNNRMTPTHANKRGRRYRYYISSSLPDRKKSGANSMRVPASEVDGLVLDRLRQLMASRAEIAGTFASLCLEARELDAALAGANTLGEQWMTMPPEELRALTRSIIVSVTLAVDRIEITIGVSQLARALGVGVKSDGAKGDTIKLSITAVLRRSGQGKRLVIGEPNVSTSDVSLVDFLKEAFATRQKLLADTSETLNEITARTTKSKGRMTALMRVSYLAPDIVTEILEGRQPPELSVKRLVPTSQSLPLDRGS